MKKIGIISLGCPKNTVDTEYLLGDLVSRGYSLTSNEEEADILIVNTCGFIGPAKQESINAILDMARFKKEGKCDNLIVTGCLAERYSDELLEEIPEIDHLFGVNQYPKLRNYLETTAPAIGSRASANHARGPAEYFAVSADRVLTTPFYTAYLKIGEGCSNRCAFCIIPKMRGPFRSFPVDSLAAQARNLAQTGVRELNLVSQDTTMYGFDLRMKDGLIRLLDALSSIEGIDWIRLFYCYPTFLKKDLMEYIAGNDKVCGYIDVPLQHTHDEMLARMNRQEREKGVRSMLETLKTVVPGVALRTTFITGFPGETEAHFRHMAGFVREMEFDHVGIFTYSHEEGTTAYQYTDDVPEDVKQARKEELMAIQQEICFRKNVARVGEVHPVLVEGIDSEEGYLVTGRLPTQGPEIDGQVLIESSEVEPGQILPMRITGASGYDLVARAV